MERLRALQRESTGAGAAEKLDWMYHAPIAAGPSTDDYMLGKAFKEKSEDKEVNQVRHFTQSSIHELGLTVIKLDGKGTRCDVAEESC